MFCHPAVRRIMIVLTALILVVLSVVEISAQNFDDDPLMIDGGDEFGLNSSEEMTSRTVILVRMGYRVLEPSLDKIPRTLSILHLNPVTITLMKARSLMKLSQH